MADHRGQDKHDAGSGDGRFDLSQFYQIFFEEAAENLDELGKVCFNHFAVC